MIYKKLSILVLIIIAFISNIYCSDVFTNDDNASCDEKNPIIPHLNSTSGKLSANNLNEHKGSESKCIWTIDISNLTNPTIDLDINKLSIGINDVLRVTDNDNKDALLYEFKGFQTPGVLLTGVKNINVTLSLSKDLINRQLSINYGSNNSTQLQNIEGTGSYVFAYYNTTDGSKYDFDLTLSTDLNGKKLLMSLENFELNEGSVTFDKVAKYNKTFDGKSKPSFLLSNEQQINIKINGFKTKKTSKNIRINYELVDSICSQYILINDIDSNFTNNMLLPNETDLNFLTSFKCFNLFEHKDNNAIFLFDLNQFKFPNIYDTITVLDGDSRDSTTLALIESEFFDYWSQLYLYSSSNQIWVMYHSPQVINKTSIIPFGVMAKSQGGNIVLNKNKPNQTAFLILNKPSSDLPVIYNLKVDEGFQAVIDFKLEKLPGNENQTFVTIYETDMKNGLPLIKLQSGNYPPDIMASNTKQMRIEFSPYSKLNNGFKVDLYQIRKGCHSSVSDISNSYSLSGCESLCSWLIPNQTTNNGTYVLQLSHLYLPLISDSIRIEKLDSQTSTVFKLSGPLKTMTFPDLNLDPSYSYVLYVERNCSVNSTDGSDLLGISFIYVKEDLRTHTMNITDVLSESIPISTQNHPNYYSVGSDHLWKFDGIDGKNVLITLTDLDLAPIHELQFRSDKTSVNFTNANVSSQASDYLMSLPLYLRLSSQTIAPKEPFSGRGFAANLTKTQCGEALEIKPNARLTISTPNLTALTPNSKCIWILTVEKDKEKLNLFQFNITYGKDVDEKIKTNLKIYDSNSIRDNRVLNLNYFNETKYSSTDSIIIEYLISDPKKDVSLTLNLTTTVCNNTLCGNSRRCMLEEWFCNAINDCGDWSDEKWCNASQPQPQPSPQPQPVPQVQSGGVNGWVVVFVICPLCIGLGMAATIFGPTLMGRFRRGRYREFQDFSEVS